MTQVHVRPNVNRCEPTPDSSTGPFPGLRVLPAAAQPIVDRLPVEVIETVDFQRQPKRVLPRAVQAVPGKKNFCMGSFVMMLRIPDSDYRGAGQFLFLVLGRSQLDTLGEIHESTGCDQLLGATLTEPLHQ